jgi:membrane protease YdiL (CAAX protease family)
MSEDSSKPAVARWSPIAAVLLIGITTLVLPTVAGLSVFLLSRVIFWEQSVAADTWLINSAFAQFIVTALSYAAMLAAVIWFVRYKGAAVRQALGIHLTRWRQLLFAIPGYVVYILFFIIAVMIVRVVSGIDVDQRQALGFDEQVQGFSFILAFISLVVLPPLCEEVLFRGFLYGTLRANKLGALWATTITSIFFAGLHLFGSTDGSLLWIAFVDVFVLSLVLCYVRERTGNIWAGVVIHALKNAVVFVNLFILGNT